MGKGILGKSIEELLATRRFAYYVPADAYVEGQGFRVSVVFEGETGHYPTGDWPYDGTAGQRAPWFWGPDYEAAKATCVEQNLKMGLTAEEAFKIVTSSMAAGHRRRKRSDVDKRRERRERS